MKPRYYIRAASFGECVDYVEVRVDSDRRATQLYQALVLEHENVELWKDGVLLGRYGWDASEYWPDWKAKPWTPEAAPTAAGPWVNERERSPEPWTGPGLDTRAFLVVDAFGVRTARRAGKNDEQQDGWIVAEMGFVQRVACWAQIGTVET